MIAVELRNYPVKSILVVGTYVKETIYIHVVLSQGQLREEVGVAVQMKKVNCEIYLMRLHPHHIASSQVDSPLPQYLSLDWDLLGEAPQASYG